METTTETVRTLVDEISEEPGGESIRLCMQCGTCTASCPNADKMDHTPSELIAMARAGMTKEVLSSNAMWYCLSCYLCTVRCPRGIEFTNLMHAFEGMAVKKGIVNKHMTTPLMYKAFNKSVAKNGKLSEFWLMVEYYLRSMSLLKAIGMTPVALQLITHGRISMKAEKMTPEGNKQLRAIVKKAEQLGGAR
jgi:heterodisulfide reductase subunit C